MDPLHITEFASERYFSKLRQLKESSEASTPEINPSIPTPTSTSTASASADQGPTFALPLGNPRHRYVEEETLPFLKPNDQPKRSPGHDLTLLRTQRRPSFSGFGSLRSKVTSHKPPSVAELSEGFPPVPRDVKRTCLGDLFLALPNELKAQIISPLPIHDILNLRLVSKLFHTLIALNESPIARYHVVHSLPKYSLRLYSLPHPTSLTLHYLCGIWHRLHVAARLSNMISNQVTKEIFLRTTVSQRTEFAPQHTRMRQRLMPLVFALFHFFEKYRELHVQHLAGNGPPLSRQPFTLNPIECEVMAMYDDQTLLKVHQVFPLVMSSFSRRLRPPSYAGRLERSIKGYLKDRPPDEVYTTILAVGGLGQAQRFWETKGYNARRAAVDTWYGYVARTSVDPTPKAKKSLMLHLGRKKTLSVPNIISSPETSNHDAAACRPWFCVKADCPATRKHQMQSLAPNTLMSGPPMRPLTPAQLRLVVPDIQPLTNVWLLTAEALILERRIVERTQDIKRNTQVLLELIKDDGIDDSDDWISGNPLERTSTVHSNLAEGGVSD